jgi:poly(3-hydroxybutyrate) depolymerase
VGLLVGIACASLAVLVLRETAPAPQVIPPTATPIPVLGVETTRAVAAEPAFIPRTTQTVSAAEPAAVPTPAPPTALPRATEPAKRLARATEIPPKPPVPTARSAALGKPVLNDDGIVLPALRDTLTPVPVLLALHGMGGSGERIAQRLGNCATSHGWALIAPTMLYRDYMDAEQVRLDEQETLPQLRDMIDSLPQRIGARLGATLTQQVFVYGFSRGAQLAHRLALFYPDHVAGVAALSAGSYTLPRANMRMDGNERPLKFPFGVADLDRYVGHPFDARQFATISFWVGVGATDTSTVAVPRLWDPYVGKTRVERAQRFSAALQSVGSKVSLNVFQSMGHEETDRVRSNVCDFFASRSNADQ